MNKFTKLINESTINIQNLPDVVINMSFDIFKSNNYKSIIENHSKISNEDIEDKLLEVTDMGVKIDWISNIIISNEGKCLTEYIKYNDKNKYYLSYIFNLSYTQENLLSRQIRVGGENKKIYNIDDYENELKNIINVNQKIKSRIKNICDSYQLTLGKLSLKPSIGYHYFIILIDESNKIDNKLIKNMLNFYQENSIVGKILKSIDVLYRRYEKDGFDDITIDYLQDDELIKNASKNVNIVIPIGVMTDDEIIQIASFSLKHGLVLNIKEYERSLISGIENYNGN